MEKRVARGACVLLRGGGASCVVRLSVAPNHTFVLNGFRIAASEDARAGE